MNRIEWLELEYAYFEAAVQDFNQYTTGTPAGIFFFQIIHSSRLILIIFKNKIN